MTIRFVFLLQLGCALLGLSREAASQELDRALVAKDPVAFIDALEPQQREAIVRDIAKLIEKKGREFDSLVNLLCEVRPWTTGGRDLDIELQDTLWQNAALETAPWTETFAALDCAAANRIDFYFSEVVNPLAKLRQDICEGVTVSSIEFEQFSQISKAIEKVDTAILRGLTLPGRNSRKFRSYFPLRNAMRRAMMEAAQGVRVADTNWTEAQKHFLNASEVLEEWNELGRDGKTRILLKNTRNGWRFHNDLQLYSALYSWLGGSSKNLDLEVLRAWPPAKEDWGVAGALGATVERRMPKSFVDFIFVERILPGAASGASECERWRLRSYNTEEFSTHVENCAEGLVPSDLKSLRQIDDCIASYQASDWRVQFLAFKRRSQWEDVADEEISKIKAALSTSSDDLSDIIESIRPDPGVWIRIMTDEKFTTARVNEVRSEVLKIYPNALFARPALY
ncbi:hypothetical protein [Pararhizobium sp. IMCC21322]|uniref:hypothetical protein n=1 Tax=Pararhizobium sp. IMCC21322 TaxID=3067903 RepID=UPI00274109F0|nr:hypothetical protein [Pararhizobium sp. IMCC21322]